MAPLTRSQTRKQKEEKRLCLICFEDIPAEKQYILHVPMHHIICHTCKQLWTAQEDKKNLDIEKFEEKIMIPCPACRT